MNTVGFLHPGAMGSALAAACHAETHWASSGRSPATQLRAERAGMIDVGAIDALANCDVVVSICPPDQALSVADQMNSTGFDGVYVDANAIAPSTSEEIRQRFDRYVDGSVIGPPPTSPGTSRLYLAGEEAETIAQLWAGSALTAVAMTGSPTAASALKMAYAGWTKAQAALLFNVAALAECHAVGKELRAEWELSQPHLLPLLERAAASVGPKAWRFAGEMAEIASAMDDANLPAAMHQGASAVFGRLAPLKGAETVEVERLLGLLTSAPTAAS